MSVSEDLPDMDGADLFGLLFHDGNNGSTEPFFQGDNDLIESWLSEQDVRLRKAATPDPKKKQSNAIYLSLIVKD